MSMSDVIDMRETGQIDTDDNTYKETHTVPLQQQTAFENGTITNLNVSGNDNTIELSVDCDYTDVVSIRSQTTSPTHHDAIAEETEVHSSDINNQHIPLYDQPFASDIEMPPHSHTSFAFSSSSSLHLNTTKLSGTTENNHSTYLPPTDEVFITSQSERMQSCLQTDCNDSGTGMNRETEAEARNFTRSNHSQYLEIIGNGSDNFELQLNPAYSIPTSHSYFTISTTVGLKEKSLAATNFHQSVDLDDDTLHVIPAKARADSAVLKVSSDTCTTQTLLLSKSAKIVSSKSSKKPKPAPKPLHILQLKKEVGANNKIPGCSTTNLRTLTSTSSAQHHSLHNKSEPRARNRLTLSTYSVDTDIPTTMSDSYENQLKRAHHSWYALDNWSAHKDDFFELTQNPSYESREVILGLTLNVPAKIEPNQQQNLTSAHQEPASVSNKSVANDGPDEEDLYI